MNKACINCKHIRGPYLPPVGGAYTAPSSMVIPSFCKKERKHFKTRNKSGKCSDFEPSFWYKIKLFFFRKST